ncbi:3-oxoacyl-[acyl-carrier-protein] synthase II [Keratinibaculum paraultunense]|uniref:3-oxoacyl-[acyl-carrier-protein] synthase 2 n=1 Tax=Keratinibaculum paraultunense TaxID=1278232 RepID=A0A4R3KZA7_9FIRM|nr:beta-ketoacyl-ACP synthase II [Keratinibaculum paraultunense]QQY80312.1 beta-ketoacyl-ACP synthase II [Keratinibaculum paraultunense]TCS90834.1 3-oxoacyl-[acyl-carrier-protein] synthase II [Keratinibaculum paraultunense]
MRRVVVTGLGPVTSIGIGKEEYWNSLIEGRSGISHITKFDTEGYTTTIGSEVKEFNPEKYMDKKEAKRMDRFAQFAIAGTQLALEDSGLDLDNIDKRRVGVVLGSGVGGIETLEIEHTKLMERGAKRVSPFFIPMMISNMGPGQITMLYGFKGPSFTITTACASGNHAIGESFRMIQRGSADIVVTGGSEAAVSPISVAGFCSMKALSKRNEEPEKASRPFDKDRDGFVIGEGAGILILEELEHALNRNAHIYGEIIGYGATSDAYHVTAPDPEAEGATMAMKLAMEDAGIDYKLVDYINAHGTSTYYNDKLETLAIKKAFKDYAYKLKISSTKSMTGHLLGAAGGIEAIATVLAMEKGIIPPTINLETPDPECDLDYTPNKACAMDINYALSNSLGFGGHNCTILFKKYKNE